MSSSPITWRRLFLSFMSWMNRSCSGYRPGAVCGLLKARHAGALREIEEQGKIEHQRRRQDGVTAEKIDFDLHRVTEPPEDVDVIPALLVVAAGRIIVDAHLVIHVPVQLGVLVGLQ